MTRQNPREPGRSNNRTAVFVAQLKKLSEKAAGVSDRGIDDQIHKLEGLLEKLRWLGEAQTRLWSIKQREVASVLVLETLARSVWGLEAIVDAAEAHARGSQESDVIRRLVEAVSHAAAIQRLVLADPARGRVAFLGSDVKDLPQPPVALRDLRNALEHFEDRLDRWALPTIARHLGREIPNGMRTPMPMRRYSGDLETFCILDYSVDIWELADWLQRVTDWARSKLPSAASD